MQQDFQSPMLSPFVQLAQANMLLLRSVCASSLSAPGSAPTGLPNPMEWPVRLMQGMVKNYVEFLAAFGQSGFSLLAAGRGSLVTLAQDL